MFSTQVANMTEGPTNHGRMTMAKSIDDLHQELRTLGLSERRLLDLAVAFIGDARLARQYRDTLNAHATYETRRT